MQPENVCMRAMELMRPWLGSNIVDGTPLCHDIALILMQYDGGAHQFEELRKQVESCLFNALFEMLGVHMTLRLDNGREQRIWLEQLPVIADEAMGALYEAMPVYSPNYRILTEYMLKSGSFSAMRVLCCMYRRYMDDSEYNRIVSVVRETYPPERYAAWLDV